MNTIIDVYKVCLSNKYYKVCLSNKYYKACLTNIYYKECLRNTIKHVWLINTIKRVWLINTMKSGWLSGSILQSSSFYIRDYTLTEPNLMSRCKGLVPTEPIITPESIIHSKYLIRIPPTHTLYYVSIFLR